ncbi:NAD-P-binding protein [Pleurotus eryngii]|uniref:NAD-P-binding protein n=1 Tax=Pleurotus eryngii TaxID=5323 RepID=A0A9P6A2T4_PLEER|nr:NAD-P-binding protein [Pleurotus eryngii]
MRSAQNLLQKASRSTGNYSSPVKYTTIREMSTSTKSVRNIQRTFLASPSFAVVGASKDTSKFGTKVLNWYKVRSFQVTPVHPREAELEGFPTISAISDLPSPTKTSISIITPPKVTLGIVQKAKELGVPALWLQPGAEDDAVIQYIKDNGLEDRVIYGGPCILVDGDEIVRSLL